MIAANLAEFFLQLRESRAESSGKLDSFFRLFESEFRQARIVRAANTPHLDVLRIFGLEFAELRHSDALAWFLRLRAEHEQGPLFINALLNLFKPGLKSSDRYTVHRERHDRTDVSVYAPSKFAVFVENKVRHSERERQVSDMVQSLVQVGTLFSIPREYRFALFLTENGAKPVTGPTEDSADFCVSNLMSLSRVELFEHFRRELGAQPVHSPLLLSFLDSYLNAIRRIRAQLS
ncbi:MAG: PD-(D/E)XK nuclease family protein [Chthoniobacter sp.]|nr:PD-(D/E)XK nuclease family protein [Chthoniobacter sp.]